MSASSTRTLSEPESKALLADAGIPCVPDRVVQTAAAAVAAAEAFGLPVVAKLSGDGIAHKTERGLVRLGLASTEAVARATTELLGAARPGDGKVGVLVAPMLAATRELIAGVHRDPQFGPCVMVGLGGVLAEAVADVAFRLIPIERVDADEMLDELAGQAVLGPVRGEPPVDRAAVVEILLSLSALVIEQPHLLSIDVNPLLVVDGHPVAADALVEVSA